MEDEKTGDENTEKKSEEVDTSKTTDEETSTNDDSKTGDDTDEGDDIDKNKEEENPYKQQLEDIEKEKENVEDEKEQLDTELRQNKGALKEEREKRKEAEEKLKDYKDNNEEDEEEDTFSEYDIDKKIDAKITKERVINGIDKMSNNDDEKKLIKYHYENSIVKSGDTVKDLKNAQTLANQHLIEKVKEQDKTINTEQETMAGMSSASSVAGDKGSSNTPFKKKAGDFLDSIGASEAKKNL